MAEAKKLDTAKLAKLLAAAKDLQDKLAAVHDEMDALLGGAAGIGTQIKTLQRDFDQAWGARYAQGQTGRYMWRHAVDVPNIKRLLKGLGPEETTARITRYIASDDPFLVRQRHPFGLFVSGINSYAAEGEAPDLELEGEAPPDCTHTPRCRTDIEHTRKRRGEMRS